MRFGNAEPGTIVEAEICPDCGVCVKSKELGCNDHGFSTIPSALAEVGEDLSICQRDPSRCRKSHRVFEDIALK